MFSFPHLVFTSCHVIVPCPLSGYYVLSILGVLHYCVLSSLCCSCVIRIRYKCGYVVCLKRESLVESSYEVAESRRQLPLTLPLPLPLPLSIILHLIDLSNLEHLYILSPLCVIYVCRSCV